MVEGECSRATTPDSGGTGGYFTLSESDASEGGKEGEMETTRVSYRYEQKSTSTGSQLRPGRVESALLHGLSLHASLELHLDLHLLVASTLSMRSVRDGGGAVAETNLRLKTLSLLDLPLPYLTHQPYPHRCPKS